MGLKAAGAGIQRSGPIDRRKYHSHLMGEEEDEEGEEKDQSRSIDAPNEIYARKMAVERSSGDVNDVGVPGFVFSSSPPLCVSTADQFPLLTVPHWFTGRHQPAPSEKQSTLPPLPADGHHNIVSRTSLLGETPNVVQSDPRVPISLRDKKDHKKESLKSNFQALSQTLPTGTSSVKKSQTDDGSSDGRGVSERGVSQTPLWKGVSEDTRRHVLASLFPSSRFRSIGPQQPMGISDTQPTPRTDGPFCDDEEKSKRFQLFCAAMEGHTAPSSAYASDGVIGAVKAAEERKEFGKVYKEMKSSSKHIKIDKLAISDMMRPIRGEMMNWKPDPIVCRRWGLADPYEHKDFIIDFPAGFTGKKQASRWDSTASTSLATPTDAPHAAPTIIETNEAHPSRSQRSAASSATVAVPRIAPSASKNVNQWTSFEDQITLTPRPAMSLFHSVFGSDDEED
eukprot:GHVN01033080.1.p1 GENE.GHVN01033080.1~~GHVN01033080.1.p1  ORF type:complete len:463 (-),score=88.32 GHVN01033080.1:74-1429(-)